MKLNSIIELISRFFIFFIKSEPLWLLMSPGINILIGLSLEGISYKLEELVLKSLPCSMILNSFFDSCGYMEIKICLTTSELVTKAEVLEKTFETSFLHLSTNVLNIGRSFKIFINTLHCPFPSVQTPAQ